MSHKRNATALLREFASRWLVTDPSPFQRWALLIGGYAALASLELAFHWLLSRPALSIIAKVYLLRTYSSGMAIFPDLLGPAVCLAAWHRWVDRFKQGRNPTLAGTLASTLMAVGVVVLLPLYGSYFPQESMWSRPASQWLYAVWFLPAFILLWLIRWGDTIPQTRS